MFALSRSQQHLVKSLGGVVRCSSSVSEPQLPPCDFQPPPYKGPSYEEVRRIRSTNVTPAALTYYRNPVLLHQGHMQYLFDHNNKRYLDCIGGMITISAGHCHPKIVKALADQSKKLWHTASIWMNPGLHEYVEKLVSKLPDPLKVVYLVNSGSEANDMAMLMARLYTGAYDIIGHRHGYHGGSPNVMGLTAMETWRFKTPGAFGIQQTMNPDVYRGLWGGKNCRDSPVQTDRPCNCGPGECQACDNYIDQLEDVLKYCTPKSGVAAMFIEPIQGGGGTTQYPREYMKRAYELVRARGGLCVSDEVQTGFGRTGTHYWAFQGHGVMPDIVTTAKGIGNGFPMAAVITTPEVANTLSRALHFNTFGGNPLASAVGSAVLDVLDEENCQENCHVQGTYLLNELAKLRDEFPLVGDVRGKGLLIGVELVKDKATRKPCEKETFGDVWEDLKEAGLLVGKGGLDQNVFRIKPPMCITRADCDFLIGTFRNVLEKHRGKN